MLCSDLCCRAVFVLRCCVCFAALGLLCVVLLGVVLLCVCCVYLI